MWPQSPQRLWPGVMCTCSYLYAHVCVCVLTGAGSQSDSARLKRYCTGGEGVDFTRSDCQGINVLIMDQKPYTHMLREMCGARWNSSTRAHGKTRPHATRCKPALLRCAHKRGETRKPYKHSPAAEAEGTACGWRQTPVWRRAPRTCSSVPHPTRPLLPLPLLQEERRRRESVRKAESHVREGSPTGA